MPARVCLAKLPSAAWGMSAACMEGLSDTPAAAAEIKGGIRVVPSQRLVTVRATKDLVELGALLGHQYKNIILEGRKRWLDFYIKQEKSLTEEQLKQIVEHGKKAIDECLPHAAKFLEGLSQATETDMYGSMLDFELETYDHIITLKKKEAKLAAKRAKEMTTSKTDSDKADAATERETEDSNGKKEHVKGHCTGLTYCSASDPDFAMAAQTVELPLKLYGYGDADVVLHLELQTEGSSPQRVLCYDVDGRCCPVGLNSAGLATTTFTLRQKHEEGFQQPSLCMQAVLWELLLGQYTLKGAMELLKSLKYPLMCGAAMLLVDRHGAVNVELNNDGVHFTDSNQNVLLRRTNHPLLSATKEHNGNTSAEQKYSEERLKQLDVLLRAESRKTLKDKDKALQDPVDKLKVGPSQAMAALCGSDLICNSRALATVVSDVAAKRLFVLFKERWPTQGVQKRRLQTCKNQVHKVKRKLYCYDLDEIREVTDTEEMDQDLDGFEEEVDSETDSETGSDSSSESEESEESEDSSCTGTDGSEDSVAQDNEVAP